MRKLFSKLFHIKPDWEFQPAKLEETTNQLRNPARGWYTIYPFFLEDEPDFKELYWCLQKEETLALVIINIGAYREKEIDAAALERMRRIFGFFAEHSYDMIVRIVYDHEGKAMEREPFFFRQVQEHITQVLPVVKEYAEHILVWQGMLIGNWGEMHTSRFLSPEKMKQLWNIMKKELENRIFLAVRRPSMWRLLHSEECGNLQSDKKYYTGLFDDAIFGSESHMGTFSQTSKGATAWEDAWSREDELAFEEQLCQRVPNGGEVVFCEEYAKKYTASETEQVLRQMHITYLNRAYDEMILHQWKNWVFETAGVWKGHSFYDYVGSHLGYRFCVRKAAIISVQKAKVVQVSVTIENTGFAPCYQETELLFSWMEETGEEGTAVLSADLCSWQPKEVKKVSLTMKLRNCRLFLSARRKSDQRAVFFATLPVLDAETGKESAGLTKKVYLGKITGVHKP